MYRVSSEQIESSVMPDAQPQDRAKILLVDDSAENLISLEATLDGLGQELVLAKSGTEALRYLLEDDFAAILLDVKMPDMDGFQTAEMIRARKRSRHTPILFLTGYKSDEHLFRGYDLGAVDFLFKPIVPEILRSKVTVFVELSRNTALLRRQTEVLGRAEQKFRSLLEAAPDAMVISSEGGLISLVNSQAEKIFRCRREELIGHNLCAIVPEWTRLSALTGAPREVNAVRKDETQFPAEISLSPLQTEEGLLVISAIRDMTDRKIAMDAIHQLNLTLGRRVAERTQELFELNESLRHSNEDLNQFAYAASHDLQEPLRMVSLYSEMLRKKYAGRLDHLADQFITFVVDGANRMEMLLKDLLEYSQAGSFAVGTSELADCEKVMETVVLNLQAAIGQNQASISWGGLPTVRAHEVRLIQLFQNLVGNAIKYRGEAPPVIRVTAEQRASDWLFSVQDNGIGIKPDYAQQIFGIFKRLHGNTYPGTGVGLAICQRIVENYGGRIWVEPSHETGSTFRFTLPQGTATRS